ncbi:adhesion G-protein coupled receptor D2 isoform X1 [Scleropages formosus]|uniref:Adhesion G-protein coupled receptor D2-like n=2 Tax=Scleropages formosus TaxID=113540 RepID=A0A8C9WVC3_SCLFO|nr:adhesion G-protein coupled receptor D2-like isoform X1 [Scleropages formosus]
MLRFSIHLHFIYVFWCLHCCAAEEAVPAPQGAARFKYGETYYEHAPAKLSWAAARVACRRRSGALASVPHELGLHELPAFLLSLNITEPLWIENAGISDIKDGFDTLIVEFPDQSDSDRIRVLWKFPSLSAVTVCTQIQLDPTFHGFSTIFSYSTQSFLKEFQLQANVTHGEAVKLSLLVHGEDGPYVEAFDNDGSWHLVCVSWTGVGGKWYISADGRLRDQGEGLYLSGDIGSDGVLVIGQKQDVSSRGMSFTGNITQLNVWDRVLSPNEIHTMEKQCSLIFSGLFFKWNFSALAIDPSLKSHWGDILCKGKRSSLDSQTLHIWVYTGDSISSLTYESNHGCMTFSPLSQSWNLDFCKIRKGAICQFHKDVIENLWLLSDFPKTSFFTKVRKEEYKCVELHQLERMVEETIPRLVACTEVLLKVLQLNPNILIPIDMLHLTQILELVSMHVSEKSASSEVISSLATNLVKLSSEIIDPELAAQWLGLSKDGVSVGPFNVIESIDKVTETLADVLATEGKSFKLSTKNIDVHLEPRKLGQLGYSSVFKPSTLISHVSQQDEILIPDTEVLRLHSLGYEEVIFIHVYYSHLMEFQSKISNSADQKEISRLATAVISATVRDSFKGQNIPVAVNYTLTSIELVEHPLLVAPVCVFWNFSLMSGVLDGWSSKGCWVTYTGSSVTSCFCNHTTNFAVLMSYMETKWTPLQRSVLTKLTFVGAGASLCALLVTLMLFTMLDIPKSDRTSIHKNLFIALTAAQVVLLCSGSATSNKVVCTVVAALLHLFFMAAFSWMLVEGLLLWSKVVIVNLSEERHMKYYYLIGWGLPVLVVAITLVSASRNYTADDHCWLSVQNGVIWGFAGPVIFIVMVNVMILARVVAITISTAKRRSVLLALGSSPSEQALEQIRAAVKAVLVLLPILGLTWLFGVLVPFSVVMAYIFVLLNSLQGLFIFLIYGVYNTEVRSAINRIKERRKALNFSNCASYRPSSLANSSQLASCPTPVLTGHSLDEEGVDETSGSPPDTASANPGNNAQQCALGVHGGEQEDCTCE